MRVRKWKRQEKLSNPQANDFAKAIVAESLGDIMDGGWHSRFYVRNGKLFEAQRCALRDKSAVTKHIDKLVRNLLEMI